MTLTENGPSNNRRVRGPANQFDHCLPTPRKEQIMDLHELIIKAHAHAHAAELAVHALSPDAAWFELLKLQKLLNDQPELEPGGIAETPPPEGSES